MIRDLLAVGVDLVREWHEQRQAKKLQDAFDNLQVKLANLQGNRQGILNKLSQEDVSDQSRKSLLRLLHRMDPVIRQMDLLVAEGSRHGLQLRPDSPRQDRI